MTEDGGNRIFLTWDGSLKKLPDMRKIARRLRDLGNTFRGCSFDRKVSFREECPVCGQPGLKDVDTPYDFEERAHSIERKRKTR